MKKKLFCLLVAALVLVASVPKTRAVTYITDPNAVSGYQYSAEYGGILDAIFRGELAMFSNTTDTFPLGSSLNTSKAYYIAGNRFGGYQCYIYAQAVYYHLFGDIPHHGNGSIAWSNSQRVVFNEPVASYELFLNSDVNFGAYIRTTINEDGSYSGSGHSMIVLHYDEAGITYLEGNADGRGLIRITSRTWDEYNTQQLEGRGRRIGFIAQCRATMCRHEYDIVGLCTLCGKTFQHDNTLSAEMAGRYAVTAEEGISLRELPYEDSTATPDMIPRGTEVDVLGMVTNAGGETWYKASCNGETGYVTVDTLSWLSAGEQVITCEITSPAEGQLVPQASFPVIGTVTSKYPLAQIEAYLDGQLYATVTPQRVTAVDLRATDVNYDLSFSTLAPGRHTLTVLARDVHHEMETVCTRTFITEGLPEYLPGDTDGDSRLTTDDAVYLLLHVMFGGVDYPIAIPDPDMNGDGSLDTDDAVYLLLHVMFGESEYPLNTGG